LLDYSVYRLQPEMTAV